MAQKLMVGEAVRFVGRVPSGAPLMATLDEADLFVLPSRQEGLPRAMLEAMARAMPCVGTAVGGIPELLPADVLVAPEDATALARALRAMVNHPARMEAASATNLAVARGYPRRRARAPASALFRSDGRSNAALAHRPAPRLTVAVAPPLPTPSSAALGLGPRVCALLEVMLAPRLQPTQGRAALQRAGTLGLFGVVYDYLFGAAAAHRAPPDLLRRRQQLALAAALRRREAQHLVSSLASAGLQVALLKGEALDMMLFGGRHLRLSGDIDLLVHRDERDEAVQLLEAQGYKRLRPLWERQKDLPLRHPERGVLVELHWAVAAPNVPAPPVGGLLARRVWVAMGDGGRSAQTLGPADHLLVLALHFHSHCGWARPLVDIAAWLDRFGADAQMQKEVLTRAQEHDMHGVLAWPLCALEALGIHVPEALRRPSASLASEALGRWIALGYRGALLGEAPAVAAWWPEPKTSLLPLQQQLHRLPRALVLDKRSMGLRLVLDPLLLNKHQREAMAASGRTEGVERLYLRALRSRPKVWLRQLLPKPLAMRAKHLEAPQDRT